MRGVRPHPAPRKKKLAGRREGYSSAQNGLPPESAGFPQQVQIWSQQGWAGVHSCVPGGAQFQPFYFF